MKTKSLSSTIWGLSGILLVVTFAPAALAQSGTQDQTVPPAASQPAPKAHEHREGEFAGLNLTDEQKAQIKRIHENSRAKSDAVMADSSLTDKAKQTEMKKIHRAAKRQARGVLTAEQRAQLRANMRERRAERSQPQSM